MKWVRFVIALTLVVIMSLVGALLALENPQTVKLDLLFIVFEPRSIVFWVITSLCLGALLGMIASGGLVMRLKTRLATNKRRLSQAQKEIDQLRRSVFSSDE